jgi:hypothetical protein
VFVGVPLCEEPPPHPAVAKIIVRIANLVTVAHECRLIRSSGVRKHAKSISSDGDLNENEAPTSVERVIDRFVELADEKLIAEGVTEHVEFWGAPEHENCTVPVKPWAGTTVTA